MNPTIESSGDPGLVLHDPIEGVRFVLQTDQPVTPTSTTSDRIPFPVDRAVTVETGELVVPKLVTVAIRRHDGEFRSEYTPRDSETVERGDRLLDVSTAPLVLYLHVPGPMALRTDGDTVSISLESTREVTVGCRSFHEHPAATVTVPSEPEPVMRAVSTFGSALKTTSSERAYPTLRGHPPRLELGSELTIPDGVERPETGVRIEVPPEFRYVFPVASLSYYLGAEVRPGPEPVLRAGDLAYALDGPGGFERSVNRTLRRLFFLDAVVRTEGLYQVPLAERSALAERLDEPLDLESLYDADLPAQLEAYLSVPTDVVDDLLPEWPLCADVTPEPSNLEALPYLVDDLALLRCADPDTTSGLTAYDVPVDVREGHEGAVDQFVRSDGSGPSLEERPVDSDVDGSSGIEETFRLPSVPTIEHAYIGSGRPLGVNKCSVSALRRRLDYTPAEEPGISVRIVCNDEAMADEDIVEEYYGLRELVQFDVTVDYGLTQRELRRVLESDVDFLHYVGHIDAEGIACADGKFDARTLDAVGVDSFLLNACSSYEQGRALVDAGGQCGVVTTSRISNTVATAMGRTLARALNSGFTFRSALSIADEHHPTSYRYLVLGDGGMQLVQSRSGMPYSLSMEQDTNWDAEEYCIGASVYPASGYGPGSTISPHIDGADTYLPFGHIGTWTLSKEELQEFLYKEIVPVSINGRFCWSDELSEIDSW